LSFGSSQGGFSEQGDEAMGKAGDPEGDAAKVFEESDAIM
jgi:hypothetical protein